MKRNLLFISRYPEIIDEFQGILEEKQIETDIAQNGTDAMELLKQKEYQILVTDLNLDGYNGDKILSYVNQKFPDTICMLYKFDQRRTVGILFEQAGCVPCISETGKFQTGIYAGTGGSL